MAHGGPKQSNHHVATKPHGARHPPVPLVKLITLKAPMLNDPNRLPTLNVHGTSKCQ